MAPPFGTILHAPGLWDIAMLLTSTGAVGDGGRDVVRADRGCGRSLPRCCSRRLERWEMALVTLPTSSGVLPGFPVLLPVAFGTFPVSSTLLPRPSCTLSFFHRRRASRRPAFLTRSRVALPNPGIPRNSVESPRRSEKY